MPSDAEIDALIERLGYHREHPLRGGYTLINPDGPEAAAFLAALRDERDILADRIRVLDPLLKERCDEAQNFYERADKAEARVRELEQKLERAEDKIDGLQADLDGAIEVAFRRGATDWTWMNYPSHFERLTATLAEIGQRE